MKTPTFPGLLQSFFVEHLVRQRNASPNTVAGYRDSFRLLLQFAAEHCGKVPSHLDMSDLDSPFIGAFLDHLEKDRGCCARTRNARLAAIHAFFRYVAMRNPPMPWSVNVSWRSQPNGMSARSSPTWRHRRPRRCSLPPISRPGSAAEIARYCCWPSRPDCASRS